MITSFGVEIVDIGLAQEPCNHTHDSKQHEDDNLGVGVLDHLDDVVEDRAGAVEEDAQAIIYLLSSLH